MEVQRLLWGWARSGEGRLEDEFGAEDSLMDWRLG